MILLPQNPVGYFCNIVLVLLLSQVAICVEDNIGIKVNQKSSLSAAPTITSSKPNLTESNGNRPDVTESITKQTVSRADSPVDLPDPDRTTKASLSHDNILSNTGLPQHSTDAAISSTQPAINKTSAAISSTPPAINKTSAPLVTNSTSSVVSNITAASTDSHPPSIVPTAAPFAAPVHKSKPETTVDEVVRDSGPTTDYVVPLVVAMLAVPLVGVLCALMYMKGRDFWERRHYGRIDFLWDSRNESRMDFLIDGMYNN